MLGGSWGRDLERLVGRGGLIGESVFVTGTECTCIVHRLPSWVHGVEAGQVVV